MFSLPGPKAINSKEEKKVVLVQCNHYEECSKKSSKYFCKVGLCLIEAILRNTNIAMTSLLIRRKVRARYFVDCESEYDLRML